MPTRPTFTSPQVTLFSAGAERASAFYQELGFTDGHPNQLVQALTDR